MIPGRRPGAAGAAPLLVIALARVASGQGAADVHWSFRPLADREPPVVNQGWASNSIDRFVLARLEACGLSPAPDAERAALIRRMALVMWGLPPTPEEVETFVSDRRPDALGQLVERLLASPRYGERWARHWLDLARFAETNGFETNTPRPDAWPYRDYVVSAFNGDLPFDRFVLEQLAGDALGMDAATGFLVGGPYDTVKSPDVVLTRSQRQDELADMVNTASTAFLGMTIACARCHDHKFDPIRQSDYYSVQAVFAGVQHGDRPLRPKDDDERLARIELCRRRADECRGELDALPVAPAAGPRAGVVVIDDEALGRTPGVSLLAEKAGHGINPPGAARGYRDDPGDPERLPNLSRGRYTWWADATDRDLAIYRAGVAGRFRLWISWGAGWDTHATDASYVLDRDGDLATEDDREPLATVDQRRFADGILDPPNRPAPNRPPPNRPLWSGLLDAGVHELGEQSCIVLRAGSEGRPVTADVIVLQPADRLVAGRGEPPSLPRLRSGVDARGNEERFAPVMARRLRFTVFATNNGIEPCLDELEAFAAGGEEGERLNVALAARVSTSGDYAGDPKHRPEHVNDGLYGNGHSWISDSAGSGWVELELARLTFVDRVTWARDREGVYADRLAVDYKIEVESEAGLWRTVATSRGQLPPGVLAEEVLAYRFAGLGEGDRARVRELLAELRRLEDQITGLEELPRVYAGRFEEPAPTRRLHRGDPMQEEEVVAPGVPAFLGTLDLAADAPERERRLAFARWVASPDNPLTARVIVNRVWMHHFGEGLVDTPSDFGAMGSAPTHPDLLDWLARELVASGWSLKHLQRLLLTSRTWRQSSRPEPTALSRDADSRLLWRFPPRRVEAEVLRDSLLFVAGSLDLRMGGPGFSTFEPNDNYVRVYVPKAELGPPEWRRMVYMTKVRMERDPTFGVFDTPDAGQVCPERTRSTTALQALNLLNDEFVLDQAQRFAERLAREAGADRGAQVERGFLAALGRRPDDVELRAALDLVEAHGLAALCRALFNANEFAFVL